jgi:hypothetical protein
MATTNPAENQVHEEFVQLRPKRSAHVFGEIVALEYGEKHPMVRAVDTWIRLVCRYQGR